MNTPSSMPLSYRDAGVDIERGNRLARRIGGIAEATRRPEVLAGVGGFGALFELARDRYREPVLVSGTDGVGTKLRIAIERGVHDTIGIDLVAMCVNDVLSLGAEPLFFLDYLASARLDETQAAAVVGGIARGCKLAGAALIGGESAEMPGMYAAGDYDLAGFCVGVVEKSAIIDGRDVRPGDALLGLASSGPHSNGYSLIRKVLETCGTALDEPLDGTEIGELLLAPTRIYVRAVRRLLARTPVHAIAHITGGGIPENLPRVLPPGTRAEVEVAAWPRPPLFDWLQTKGRIAADEMLRTFNCGIGMVVCVPAAECERATEVLRAAGETVWPIGRVTASAEAESRVRLR